jgi:4-hydroxy-4-methyl-2-oxoglutarate aldolase
MADVMARLAELGTATISDALDRLGLPGSAHGIRPLANGTRMAGPAYTVRYVPAGDPAGTVGDYVDDIPDGGVAVLDNQGRTDATVWGDILTTYAHHNRIAGTVIWGVCRDVRVALETGYPMFSAGRFMRTGKDRVEVADVQVPVAIGDVRVAPGDIVVGDDDGVVVIPAHRLDQVHALAEDIGTTEDAIAEAVVGGMTITDARAKFGYHTLQRKGQ